MLPTMFAINFVKWLVISHVVVSRTQRMIKEEKNRMIIVKKASEVK